MSMTSGVATEAVWAKQIYVVHRLQHCEGNASALEGRRGVLAAPREQISLCRLVQYFCKTVHGEHGGSNKVLWFLESVSC